MRGARPLTMGGTMDRERREVREQEREGAVTCIYREDPEACAEAVLYVLKMRQPEPREERITLEELPGE